MTTTVTVTVKGESLTVERIVFRQLGRYVPGIVESVYALNPGLAKLGIHPPVGTKFKIPQPTAAQDAAAVQIVKLTD